MTGFTEKEAIEIAMEHGVSDGSEMESAIWKKRGCLKGDSVESLKKKLHQVFENVEVEGKGKKRRYILTNQRETIIEKETDYKGRIRSPYDDTMKEYIFNTLLKMRNKSNFTISRWIKELGFPHSAKFNLPAMTEEIKYYYRDPYYLEGVLYNPKQCVTKFTDEIRNRSKAAIMQQLKQLENEGRIKISEWYMGRESTQSLTFDKNESNILITFEKYSDFKELEQELVEEHDGQINAYRIQNSSTKGFTSPKYKGIHEEIQPILEAYTDLEYVYITYEIEVIDKEIKVEVSKKEFIEVYYKKFVELITHRQKKEKYYGNTEQVDYRFFYFNCIVLMKLELGEPYEGFNKLVEEAISTHYEEVQNFLLDYAIHLHDKEEAKKIRRNTFGEIE